jgi:alcohol dehydrogenase YqhD (iron-dependent ADH family)
MPTKVIMGKDCIRGNEAILKEAGSKAMIVTGANSARSNGSL